jgi:transposase, IS5 family
VPERWSPAKRARMDTDNRWRIKRARRHGAGEGEKARVAEIAVPVFGYRNHLTIDCRHGLVHTHAVTDAAPHDGQQLGRLLDFDNTASEVCVL